MNRRQFLQTFGLATTAALQTSTLHRALASLPPGAFAPANLIDRDPIAHVISRLTFGVTPDLYQHVQTIGSQAFIEEQLAFETLADPDITTHLNPYAEVLGKNAGVLLKESEGMAQVAGQALLGGTTVRAMYSQRQLYERMVHFFSDHFSIYVSSAPLTFMKVDDDRDVARAYAMGTFRAILGASAHSPAMLDYLDNATSAKDAPNENYARELMELHTLSVDGGYTETDVKEVARCFTGWSMTRPRDSEDGLLKYLYRPRLHDDGAKTVLGTTIPAGGGERDGEQVLDLLASHSSTAEFISYKLVRRFVSDFPPDALVQACAEVFMQTGGDIRAVLRTIFNSEDFWNAPPKFKQPYEYTISLLRAFDTIILDGNRFLRNMRNSLDGMGQIPFHWPAPNGFPDVQGAWADNLLPRWNMATAIVGNQLRGAQTNTEPFLNLLESRGVTLDPEAVFAFLAQYLLGRPLTTDENGILMDFVNSVADTPESQIMNGIGLLLASPAFQYR